MSIPNLDPFQVIADPCRRQILELLTKDTSNIKSMVQNFEISRPAISKHIKILERSKFISIKKVGRERQCSLNQNGFEELKDWIVQFDSFWNSRLKNLEHVLNKKVSNNY